MTLNYFQMFHEATREHAESLASLSPMREAIRIDDARHMRAPMYEGELAEWITIECECGATVEGRRGSFGFGSHPNDGWQFLADDWRIERCDGSSCGTENCGRMLAKCGRCGR